MMPRQHKPPHQIRKPNNRDFFFRFISLPFFTFLTGRLGGNKVVGHGMVSLFTGRQILGSDAPIPLYSSILPHQ